MTRRFTGFLGAAGCIGLAMLGHLRPAIATAITLCALLTAGARKVALLCCALVALGFVIASADPAERHALSAPRASR